MEQQVNGLQNNDQLERDSNHLNSGSNLYYCRALYDYVASTPTELSFRKDEIMEILSRDRSGWWDGLIEDRRGWFPSNYVVLISEEEAERLLLQSRDNAST